MARKKARNSADGGIVQAMENKTYDAAVEDLKRASARYEQLQGHFEQFCGQAARLDGPGTPVKGITVKREGPALLVAFLDRRISVNLRFDRNADKGVLHVEDISAAGRRYDYVPKTIARVLFDAVGTTDLVGGQFGGNISLGQPADCMTLAVRFIDLALGS